VFFPAAGRISFDLENFDGRMPGNRAFRLNEKGTMGFYWTSSGDDFWKNNSVATSLYFDRNDVWVTSWQQLRAFVYFIRPVWAGVSPTEKLGRPYVQIPNQNITANSIFLMWPRIHGADSYNVYVSINGFQDYRLIATVPATTAGVSFTHTGLQPGTSYNYRVAAVNSAGEGELSAMVGGGRTLER
jgi:hypothetical protein